MIVLADFEDLPILPIVVFIAELCVVTLCTLRIIFISRGMKFLAPLAGFFEITIWLFAIGQVMRNLTDPACFMGFALGFTLGNYLGLLVEKWLALGNVLVRTITDWDPAPLIASLQSANFGVTSLDAAGARGPVKMVFTVVRRKQLDKVLTLVRSFDPNAFYSVDDIMEVGPGIFPRSKQTRGVVPSIVHFARKTA